MFAVEGGLSYGEEVKESPRQSWGVWVLCPDQLYGQILCKSFEVWVFWEEEVAHVSHRRLGPGPLTPPAFWKIAPLDILLRDF